MAIKTDPYREFGMQVREWVELGKRQKHAVFVLLGEPEARVLLQLSRGNRTISDETVDTYLRQIQAGEWTVVHQGIGVDVTGRLYDGHHRLEAVAKSSSRVEFQITFGMPESAAAATDGGRARSQKDRLYFGHGVAVSSKEIAVVRAAMRLEQDTLSMHVKQSDGEVLRAKERYAKALSRVEHIMAARFPASFWGAIVFAYDIDPDVVVTFAEDVLRGTELPDGSPAFCLREYIRDADTAGTANQLAMQVKTLSALKATVEKRALHKFATRDPDNVIRWAKERRTKATKS